MPPPSRHLKTGHDRLQAFDGENGTVWRIVSADSGRDSSSCAHNEKVYESPGFVGVNLWQLQRLTRLSRASRR